MPQPNSDSTPLPSSTSDPRPVIDGTVRSPRSNGIDVDAEPLLNPAVASGEPTATALTLADPRFQIQAEIREVSALIDQKRRHLLRSDRAFVRDNLRQLQDALTMVIEILRGTVDAEAVDAEAVVAKDGVAKDGVAKDVAAVADGDGAWAREGQAAEAQQDARDRGESFEDGNHSEHDSRPDSEHESPFRLHIHSYLFAEKGISLDDYIAALQTHRDNLQPQHDDSSPVLQQPDAKLPTRQQFLVWLADVESLLNQLVDIQHWSQMALISEGWNQLMERLWAEVEIASQCIESLRGNARLDVAKQLNRLKLLLTRIHLYSHVHGLYIPPLKARWGLPTGALRSAIERVRLVVSDAEWGTSCSLELLQDTEVAISRMMYRYEYGAPFKWPVGWVINRVNDGKRLVGSIKRWHDDENELDSSIIKTKILLGLSITSMFWVCLFLAVSGFSLVAKVGIAILTPTDVQQRVESGTSKVDDVRTLADGHLTRYRNELSASLEARITDKNALVERSLFIIDSLVTDELATTEWGSVTSASAIAATTPANPEATAGTADVVPSAVPTAPPAPETTPTLPPQQTVAAALIGVQADCQLGLQPPVEEGTVAACSLAISALLAAVEAAEVANVSNDQAGADSAMRDSLVDALNTLDRTLIGMTTALSEQNELRAEQQTLDASYLQRKQSLDLGLDELRSADVSRVPDNTPNPIMTQIWRTLFSWSKNDVFNGHINRIMLALLAGALGSVISLLIRINDLEPNKLTAPFLLGLFQPFIGAVTSVAVVAILSTDAVDVIDIFPEQLQLREFREMPVSQPGGGPGGGANGVDVTATRTNPVGRLDTHEVYKILVIGFFVGFSERLAKDALGRLNPGGLGGR